MAVNEEQSKKGGISVERNNIFPIIKKWLYSEKDIFLREIVSNASDAVTKLKRLSSLGQLTLDDTDFKINIVLDKDEKTVTVSDNGIGMSEDELTRYICQIALSGALEFIEKYENAEDTSSSGIIGHFGLGFYSAFMVSDTVEVITKSYTDAPAVKWVCNESGEYEIFPSDRQERGTDVIMHITEDEAEYLDSDKLRSMMDKYCAFMPVDIFFRDASNKDAAEEEKPINDKYPLWLKNPSDITKEEYENFYKKVFTEYRNPLFQIHINADYPLNFKGILYFPGDLNEYESVEGQVKLYYNQVFVADNIKEILPDYLLMLRGVLDCPELPLNVSRSYLQNNAYVSKVASHIVKKVADKLNSMCNLEYEEYEKIWESLKLFVEYACMRDKKFYDRVKPSILLKMADGSHTTVDKYLEGAKELHENTVYYATDLALQANYISMFEAEGIKIAVFEKPIDVQFISILEQYTPELKFIRIDAGIADALKNGTDAAEDEEMKKLFTLVSGNEKLKVTFETLKDERTPAILNISEESRRFDEMMKMYSIMGGNKADMPSNLESTLVINTSSALIRRLSSLMAEDADKAQEVATQIYRLSLLSQRKFSADEMKEFLSDSFDMLLKY